MKRSDLIKLVVLDLDGKVTINTVHEILFLLESYGMKPPKYLVKENKLFWDPNRENVVEKEVERSITGWEEET